MSEMSKQVADAIEVVTSDCMEVWFTDICPQDKFSQHYMKYGQMLTKFIISFHYLF